MNVSRIAAAALMVAVASACGYQSASVAPNGYGSGATVMIHSQLRSGTPDKVGAALCKRLIAVPGVVFTNFSRRDGLTVGLADRSAVRRVEDLLRAQPAVRSVAAGPAPTASPASTKG